MSVARDSSGSNDKHRLQRSFFRGTRRTLCELSFYLVLSLVCQHIIFFSTLFSLQPYYHYQADNNGVIFSLIQSLDVDLFSHKEYDQKLCFYSLMCKKYGNPVLLPTFRHSKSQFRHLRRRWNDLSGSRNHRRSSTKIAKGQYDRDLRIFDEDLKRSKQKVNLTTKGLEPSTFCSEDRCSTIEPRGQQVEGGK